MYGVDGVLVLAAGLGERLKPITENIPKPLIRIKDIPIIVFPLYLMVKSGFRRIIVNSHHLADILENFLLDFGKKNSIDFVIIREEKLLGTGGTIKYVFENFGFEKILVINSDSVGDFDIPEFLNEAFQFDSIAHIMLYQDSSIGGIDLNLPSRYVNIKGEGRGGNYTFCGVHLVDRKIVNFLSQKRDIPLCIIRDGYIPAISYGEKISASIHTGLFSDAGTYERIEHIKKFPNHFFERIKNYFSLP